MTQWFSLMDFFIYDQTESRFTAVDFPWFKKSNEPSMFHRGTIHVISMIIQKESLGAQPGLLLSTRRLHHWIMTISPQAMVDGCTIRDNWINLLTWPSSSRIRRGPPAWGQWWILCRICRLSPLPQDTHLKQHKCQIWIIINLVIITMVINSTDQQFNNSKFNSPFQICTRACAKCQYYVWRLGDVKAILESLKSFSYKPNCD